MKYKQWNRASCPLERRRVLEEAGFTALAALALYARGLDTPEKAAAFLAADRGQLQDPMEMRDMDRAAGRVAQALERGERIAVYGDYDVDGITSTCLLTDFLRREGGEVLPYIPDRLEEGYGLNREALDTLCQEGVRLVVTVDCGITAVEEADYARELGMDLVITDHHECKAQLPRAMAVVDPHRSDCPYPFKSLAGVGVALKLVLALGGPDRQRELLERYADLAAIGTVADVMNLTGENRTIVRLGLEVLRHTARPGLKALLRQAGMEERPLTSVAIGYTLAPRLNASGRMGRANLAAELLLTADPARGEELAVELCQLNRERQAIEAEIYDQCIPLVQALPQNRRYALVLAGEQWHQGVVGIVASRLADRYSCPTFMICLQDGKGKGSCRSFAGFNLFAALEHCTDLLESFGGHALAAGFTILEENIPAFAQAMNDYVCACTGGKEMVAALDIDAEVEDLDLLTLEEVEGLDLLEPCGAGNPKPVFSLSGCMVTALSEVGGGRHLKLKLSAGGRSLDAIFFSTTAAEAGVAVGERVDAAFTPQVNEYRGWRSVQLQLCDLRPALTRAQAERALYEKFRRGESLTPAEAAALLPSREEFVVLWRYLQGHAQPSPLEETAHRLARNIARSAGKRETVMRTLVCLEVFDERGLIQLEHTTDHLHIALCQVEGKVDLEASWILRRLREMGGLSR
ncbi:single-stranded-DNA-specific exonuclease RecJ [Pseudoflavonifractor phocaeensis]|uniref:single-stranded-DNA-specific exonuclease RecJ n=1 Tax=Pseudoflavonifractor phocaeensis TaxID=1870988 RepID=UPI00195E2387|nr:single-stranded-DNA-specific exonuclease RecJ [Pseudoflavonifractor phocaeensis]MBM6887517.1 single-stranded-DNA-specific exonuclease RecJ [Pseudoflavonifractor phocaeensis]